MWCSFYINFKKEFYGEGVYYSYLVKGIKIEITIYEFREWLGINGNKRSITLHLLQDGSLYKIFGEIQSNQKEGKRAYPKLAFSQRPWFLSTSSFVTCFPISFPKKTPMIRSSHFEKITLKCLLFCENYFKGPII